MPPIKMKSKDKNALVELVARRATSWAAGPRPFFTKIIQAANIPPEHKQSLIGPALDYPEVGASQLVHWAVDTGKNPEDKQTTALGSLLAPALKDFGYEDRLTLLATFVVYKLLDEGSIRRLAARYNIPVPAEELGDEPPDVGPDIIWHGPPPDEEIELQASGYSSALLDVGSLKRAMRRTSSVCRIEIPSIDRTASGFLISRRLVLTNYHVLRKNEREDPLKNAQGARLRFASVSDEEGEGETDAGVFTLVPDSPIVKSSPVKQHDYALLRVVGEITEVKEVRPLEISSAPPTPGRKTGLHILQHPAGGPMKLALSENGVSWVSEADGLIQYVTATARGSSGAPCFTDDWKLVAIHHAQRAKLFGAVREGILMSTILKEIEGEVMKDI